MRIIIAIHALTGSGGTEAYVTTVGDHLQRAGHNVWIYGREDGICGDRARALGLRVCTAPEQLPESADAALVQDAPVSLELLAERPLVPQVFVWHSELFDVQLPPQIEGAIARIVTVYESAFRRISAMAVKPPVVRLAQPVDLDRFRPLAPLPAKPRKALSLGNYLQGERAALLEEACELAGIELMRLGTHGERMSVAPEDDINRADIVFAKAKTALEAMACGRAVYVFDEYGADGWVTAENYARFAAGSFAGNLRTYSVTARSLAAELDQYDAAMGMINRDLALSNHSAITHAGAIAELLGEVAGTRPRIAERDDLFELERLTRVNWRHESRAFRLAEQVQQLNMERGDFEWRMEVAAVDHAAELAAERERLDEAVAEAERAISTLRWRAVNTLLAPLDRLRMRSR